MGKKEPINVETAAPTAPTAPPRPVGRPPAPFFPEYCEKLIDHMRQGGSFESFGAIAKVGKETLYKWLGNYPEFADARKEAVPLLASFYENMGKMLATGQLRRVKVERPMLTKDKDGKDVPMYDQHGNVLMEREFEPAQGNATAWIFLCKNMLGWRDKRDVMLSGDPDGAPIRLSPETINDQDLQKRIQELARKALHAGEQGE